MSTGVLISHDNHVDTATLTLGSWLSSGGIALSNLASDDLSKVARSSSAALPSTLFQVDQLAERPIKIVAISAHNLSLNALVRIRAGNTSGDFSVPDYDSGWIAAWPPIYTPESLEWGDPRMAALTPTAAMIAAGYRMDVVHALSEYVTARYVYIEIDDTANADGYVQMGRLWIGTAWSPRTHDASSTLYPSTGASFQWDDPDTRVIRTDGQANVYDARRTVKRLQVAFRSLSTSHAMAQAAEIMRHRGKSGQLYVTLDDSTSVHFAERSFLARMRELNALEVTNYDHNTATFQFEEVIQ